MACSCVFLRRIPIQRNTAPIKSLNSFINKEYIFLWSMPCVHKSIIFCIPFFLCQVLPLPIHPFPAIRVARIKMFNCNFNQKVVYSMCFVHESHPNKSTPIICIITNGINTNNLRQCPLVSNVSTWKNASHSTTFQQNA